MKIKSILRTAQLCVGNSSYCFKRECCDGLNVVNCFTFMHHLYASCGVAIPNDLGEMLKCGSIVDSHGIMPGDWILTGASWGGYNFSRRGLFDVGHIGLVANDLKVTHACSVRNSVVNDVIDWPKVRGAIRF